MGDMTLFNFGNLGESGASVINHFMDYIANVMGWIVSPKGLEPSILEANRSIIMEIAERKDIDLTERLALVNNYKKLQKEYKNQTQILDLSLQHLKQQKQGAPDVSEDWITFFMEHAKNISDGDMQQIWARILAGEFNAPKSFSKQFIHIMSLLDSDVAHRFQKIRSSCFYTPPYLYTCIYRLNKTIKNVQRYQEIGIRLSDLRELEVLGLIKHRPNSFYSLALKNKGFEYGNKYISLRTDKHTIAMGNVELTNLGKQLCRISPMVYDEDILSLCLEAWTTLGYHPTVKTMNQKESYVEMS